MKTPYEIRKGDKVAQLLEHPFLATEVLESDPDAVRGSKGFGSSGGWLYSRGPTDPSQAQTHPCRSVRIVFQWAARGAVAMSAFVAIDALIRLTSALCSKLIAIWRIDRS